MHNHDEDPFTYSPDDTIETIPTEELATVAGGYRRPLRPLGDRDGDGVRNIRDRRPLNPCRR
jgi:hypothetical protein